MLVHDEAAVARLAQEKELDTHRELIRNYGLNQLRDKGKSADKHTSPANVEYQMGKALTVTEVERRLKALNPNLVFEFDARRPDKKYMYHVDRVGKHYIMPYEAGPLISEFSIMQEAMQETLLPEVVAGTFHINRKDLPKHEVIPHEFNSDGSVKKLGDVVFDETQPLVGMERTKTPWHEARRGWRTMLWILVAAGHITATQADNFDAPSDREEWAKKLGKR